MRFLEGLAWLAWGAALAIWLALLIVYGPAVLDLLPPTLGY